MEEKEKVKESLMINPLAYPEEKFTEDGKSYYYTRGDGTPITQGNPLSLLRLNPKINTIWSQFDKPDSTDWTPRDLAFPLNVPYGGKRQGNLSDWTFTNWLVNAAPGQLAPLIAPFAARTQPTYRIRADGSKHKITDGGKTLLQQRSLNKYKKQFEKVDDNLIIQDLPNVTPVTPQKGADILDKIFKWKRFSNNTITERERLLESNVTGMVTKDDPIALGRQEFDEGSIPGLDGQDYAFESTIRQHRNESNADYIKRYWDTKFDELGIPEGVRFSLREMLDSDHLTKAQRRNIKSGISNPNYIFKDYKESRQILVNDFLDGLEAFGIDPSTIEIHHISSLRHVSQLFEGLERSEWPEMLAELYKAGLATGNDPDNLMAMFAKAHRSGRSSDITSIHGYLDEQLGKYNERITGDFGDNIRELSVKERIPSIRRYAQVRQSSIEVGNEAIREVLDQIVRDQPGGEAASLDANTDMDKYTDLLSSDQIEYVKAKIKRHLDYHYNPQAWGALSDAVKDNVSGAKAKQNRGLSPSGPTQNQLMDLGKKTPKNKPDDDPPIGSGWDITDPNE